ncbi:S26 family signal peptidase [Vibrio anguillarum]|uniref:Peptidase S26 domain-containing protein n=1 Tax=Vibrio anguillarum TaxID=55601 RepID=A0AAW4BID3_VIBAN|nr:S26 family signal peptidase [Vibrio anguillarum]MBF4374117.1 hypothetical protein [Vibrio anguillarum]MBF4436851.1 hypothetical protein [Vibrio anguillarum]
MKRNITFILILAISAFSIDALYSKLTINLTESLPYRLFWIGNAPFEKGGYVMFESPTPKLIQPFVKSVGCVSGDTLQNRQGSFYCNEKWLGNALDSMGDPDLEPFEFSGKIPEGYFFALGTHPSSYDSRYFGLIESAKAQPVNPIF